MSRSRRRRCHARQRPGSTEAQRSPLTLGRSHVGAVLRPVCAALSLTLLVGAGSVLTGATASGAPKYRGGSGLTHLALGSAVPRRSYGIAQNNTKMFNAPGFQRLRVARLRLGVCWNVALHPGRFDWNEYIGYLEAAQRQGMKVIISFQKERWRGECRKAPSPKGYRKGVRAFLRDFHRRRFRNTIEGYTAWNEPNHPAFKVKAATAARYHRALNALLRRVCRSCPIAAGDLATGHHMTRYLRQLKTELRKRNIRPRLWALHPYGDVWARRPTWTRRFLSLTASGRVWFTEVGGRCHRGKRNPACPPHRGMNRRQLRAQKRQTKYLVGSLANESPRIRRIYYYHFNGGDRKWDTGLASPSGRRLRPAYYVYCRKTRGRRC